MDQFEVLVTQHREIRKLLHEALQSKSAADRVHALEAVRSKIEVHTYLEEACVYPMLEDYNSLKRQVYGFWREHDKIRQEQQSTLLIHQQEQEFQVRLSALISLFDEHVREEEVHIFPEARKLLGADQLETMARNLKAMISERWIAA